MLYTFRMEHVFAQAVILEVILLHLSYPDIRNLTRSDPRIHRVLQHAYLNNIVMSSMYEWLVSWIHEWFPDSYEHLTVDALKQCTELILIGGNIRELPSEIGFLTNLQTLYVEGLVDMPSFQIPKQLFDLKNLGVLSITRSMLDMIPDDLGNLVHLTRLDLSINVLKTLPLCIANLAFLEDLDLHRNFLIELPNISSLISLRILNLSHNAITTIPDDIAQLTRLTHLKLDHNRITAIPMSLTTMKVLKLLKLDHNRIEYVPDELGMIQSLEKVTLSHNRIHDIPISLLREEWDPHDFIPNGESDEVATVAIDDDIADPIIDEDAEGLHNTFLPDDADDIDEEVLDDWPHQ